MTPAPWKVMVVDDAEEVRTLTRLALEDFSYRGRSLTLLEAASADEAKVILASHGDVAAALVDVVMETDHAGLDLVKWIRTERQDPFIRLLVRTGQAGRHPASAVIGSYEINDYWEKTELTYGRLRQALTLALRGYDDLMVQHRRTFQIRHWADRFPDLLAARDWTTLLRLVMVRIRELFPDHEPSAFLCRNDGRRWPLMSGTGRYPADGGPDVLEHLDEGLAGLLLEAWDRRDLVEASGALALYFSVDRGEGHLLYLEIPEGFTEYDRQVARLVLQNFRAALGNRVLIDDLERHRNELSALVRTQDDVARDLHHRFQTSLQVVLSFIDIEGRDRSGITGRSPLAGAQRRLHALSLLHSVMRQGHRTTSVDLQPFLRALVDDDRDRLGRPSSPGIEYWGVPVEVEADRAVPLALAAVEMIDLISAPRFRSQGRGPVQVTLADQPRRLTVGRDGLAVESEEVPLEWNLLTTLAAQVGGQASVGEGRLVLVF